MNEPYVVGGKPSTFEKGLHGGFFRPAALHSENVRSNCIFSDSQAPHPRDITSKISLDPFVNVIFHTGYMTTLRFSAKTIATVGHILVEFSLSSDIAHGECAYQPVAQRTGSDDYARAKLESRTAPGQNTHHAGIVAGSANGQGSSLPLSRATSPACWHDIMQLLPALHNLQCRYGKCKNRLTSVLAAHGQSTQRFLPGSLPASNS